MHLWFARIYLSLKVRRLAACLLRSMIIYLYVMCQPDQTWCLSKYLTLSAVIKRGCVLISLSLSRDHPKQFSSKRAHTVKYVSAALLWQPHPLTGLTVGRDSKVEDQAVNCSWFVPINHQTSKTISPSCTQWDISTHRVLAVTHYTWACLRIKNRKQ